LHLRAQLNASHISYSTGTTAFTVRLACRVVPLHEAEIVAFVEKTTMLVLTGKIAVVAPAGTVTLEGTPAAELSLERRTCTPPPGAAALRVTVPVEDCAPPVTLDGLSAKELRVGRGGGKMVRTAVRVTPLYEAEIVTEVDVVTWLVATGKVALRAPATTVTLAGT